MSKCVTVVAFKDFFLAPARPIQNHPHKERFWRLSFHVQERQIIFHRYRLKPAMRVLKVGTPVRLTTQVITFLFVENLWSL